MFALIHIRQYKNILLPMLTLILLFLSSSFSYATTVYDNLSETSGGTESTYDDFEETSIWLGQSFTTGTESFDLGSITLLLAGDGTASVSLYSTDESGLPTDVLTTLSSSDSLTETLSEITFSTTYTLDASTTYWVVISDSDTDDSTSVLWSFIDIDTGESTDLYGWGYDEGALWFTDSGLPFQMSISSELPVTTVPIPAAAYLFLSSLLGFAMVKTPNRS